MTFSNESIFSLNLLVQELPVILKLKTLNSLENALNCFMELRFSNVDIYILNSRKNV